LQIKKSYNTITITRNKTNIEKYNIKIEKETLLPNGHTISIIEQTNDNSNYCIKLNSKEIV
ncbi:MAG TPA: hypothetical protein DCE23_04955, partial [Firmicutes bacterium]|nr:hypothetical protein [Bacillota bacterium]